METKTLEAVKKIWDSVYTNNTWKDFAIDLDIHKKLLSILQPGDYYYWILNSKTGSMEYVSPEAEKVLGYPMHLLDLNFFFNLFHPDDRPYFLNFEMAIADFLNGLPNEKRTKYKIQYDFRFKKANGDYARILNQMIVLQYEEKESMIRTLGFQTDITHIKKEGKPKLSLIGLEGEPSYYDINVKKVFKPSREILTHKEKEVLCMLTQGKISKEIGLSLNISKTTVDSHRRNMLKKTNCKSTSELVNTAILSGWI